MTTTQELDDTARAILAGNDKGKYTIPTSGLYPYQWNWDSAFAALGFAQYDVNRAWIELETLFSGQWDDGMVPHILFHSQDPGYFPGPEVWGGVGPIPSSGISQPPIAATMARFVFEKNPAIGATRLSPLFEKFVAWHQWFMDWRLDKGAVCITHPWEAGRDNAPDWDVAMAALDPTDVGEYTRRDTTHVDGDMRPTKHDYDRYVWLVQQGKRLKWDQAALLKQNPFRVADPTMTFTLLRSSRDLLALGKLLKKDVSKIENHIAILEEGVTTLWNDSLGCFDARDIGSGRWANSISNASFLCWYGGIDNPAMLQRLEYVLSDVQFAVPSYNPHDTKFDAKRYWRGPVWAIMNMMIAIGMEEMGIAHAAQVRQSTQDLIAQKGFAEYFDPTDGSPAGGSTFTWTAAVWLSWASPSARV